MMTSPPPPSGSPAPSLPALHTPSPRSLVRPVHGPLGAQRDGAHGIIGCNPPAAGGDVCHVMLRIRGPGNRPCTGAAPPWASWAVMPGRGRGPVQGPGGVRAWKLGEKPSWRRLAVRTAVDTAPRRGRPSRGKGMQVSSRSRCGSVFAYVPCRGDGQSQVFRVS